MNKYESVIIIDPSLEEQGIKPKKSKKSKKAMAEYDSVFDGEEQIGNKLSTIKSDITFVRKEIEIDDNELTAYTYDGSKAAHYEHTIAITNGEAIILTGEIENG